MNYLYITFFLQYCYTFFNKMPSNFAENKMYYRVRNTIPPSIRHDTTEYTTRSPPQKVAILSSSDATKAGDNKIPIRLYKSL